MLDSHDRLRRKRPLGLIPRSLMGVMKEWSPYSGARLISGEKTSESLCFHSDIFAEFRPDGTLL